MSPFRIASAAVAAYAVAAAGLVGYVRSNAPDALPDDRGATVSPPASVVCVPSLVSQEHIAVSFTPQPDGTWTLYAKDRFTVLCSVGPHTGCTVSIIRHIDVYLDGVYQGEMARYPRCETFLMSCGEGAVYEAEITKMGLGDPAGTGYLYDPWFELIYGGCEEAD